MAVTPPVLFERDAELQAIADLRHGAKHGTGALVLVEAPAGLGKSALLDDAAASASAAGLLVLRASGHQLERAFGWGVARRCSRGCCGGPPQGLVGVLDGPAAPARAVLLGDPGGVAGSAGAARPGSGSCMRCTGWWCGWGSGGRGAGGRRCALGGRAVAALPRPSAAADLPTCRSVCVVGARPAGADVEGVLGVVAADPATRVLRLRPLSAVAVEKLVRDRWPAAIAGGVPALRGAHGG